MGQIEFLNPWAFLGLLALPAVILLYFLRLRRREKIVPSTLLWRSALQDMRANTPLQRLRVSVLLLLQLLALAAVTLAMARPTIIHGSRTDRKAVILLDTSASMTTRDAGDGAGVSRFEQAIRDLRARINAIRGGESVLIAAFDNGIYSHTRSFLSSRAELLRFIDKLRVRHVPTDFSKTVRQAAELVETGEKEDWNKIELLILSDGGFSGAGTGEFSGDLPPDTVFAGYGRKESYNAGIVSASIRLRPPPPGEETPGHLLVFTVENFSEQPMEIPVQLVRVGDSRGAGDVEETRVVVLAPHNLKADRAQRIREGAIIDVRFELPPDRHGLYEARLPVKDGFSPDNRVLVDVRRQEGIQLLFVGETRMGDSPDSMRHPVFLAVEQCPEVNVTAVRWKEYRSNPPAPGQYDIVVFNNVPPETFQPPKKDGGDEAAAAESRLLPGAYLFLNAVPPKLGFSVSINPDTGKPAVVGDVKILDWDNSHPALYYSKYRSISVLKALKVKAPDNASVLLRATHGPLITATDFDGIRTISTFFDPLDSDWIFAPELPLFILGSIEWLADASARTRGTQVRTGEILEVFPVPGAAAEQLRTVVLSSPDSGQRSFEGMPADRSFAPAYAERVGLYRARGEGTDQFWCSNLLSEAESNNSARTSVRAGAGVLKSERRVMFGRREIRKLLLAVVIGLLMLEWAVYHLRL